MEIRDTRNGSWYWVNTAVNACPHITASDKTVYSALCTFSGYSEIRPSFDTISLKSAVPIRTCKRAIKRLHDVGIIAIDNHGKRGVANVYTLLKVAHGCQKCQNGTTSEKGHNGTTEVPKRAKRSATVAPHIDKIDNRYISNSSELQIVKVNKEDEEVKPRTKTDTSYRGVFELWGKYPENWKLNKTQIQAAKNLISEHGLEEVSEALDFARKKSKDPFCPQISSPYDLDSKWLKLEAYLAKL